MPWGRRDAAGRRAADRSPTLSVDPEFLRAAYADCERIARRHARNFYYAFLVLPRPQRHAMCALYAFMRHTDDLGDSTLPIPQRRQELADWRRQLHAAVAGDSFPERWWHALADTLERYDIPMSLLEAVIDGVASDLETSRYADFATLYHYCYQVASTVGLACIRIWGVTDRRADTYAEWMGIAFQLTNILRDIVEDEARGRIYVPLEDLSRFGLTPDNWRSEAQGEAFRQLMRFEIERAHGYFERAAPLRDELPPAGRAVLCVLADIYRGLLRKIERDPLAVLERRVALPACHKLALLLRAIPIRFAGRRG